MVVDQIPHQWLLPHERFTNVIPCDGAKRELQALRESTLCVAPA